jgi:hypothetical protein
MGQSRNHLFRSAAKICAGEIRRAANDQQQTGKHMSHHLHVHMLWFSDDGIALVDLPKDADVLYVRDCECPDAVELHVIENVSATRMDPRTFYRVRCGEPMPAAVGRGDLIASFTHCSGEIWHIFAGQYDRGVMTKELPAQHRAITRTKVLAND